MRIKDVYEILKNLKDNKVTQSDIARAIGTTRANVSKLIKNDSYINGDKIEKIEKYVEVKLSGDEGMLNIDYYPEGLLDTENRNEFSKKVIKSKMAMALFSKPDKTKQHIMFHSSDNSMAPKILEGDFLVVEVLGDEPIQNKKIYAFLFDNTLYIRRIMKNINQFIFEADNEEYPTRKIDFKELKDFKIIGRVIYTGRTNL